MQIEITVRNRKNEKSRLTRYQRLVERKLRKGEKK